MPVATFDTLKFANTLKNAGVPPAQAEAQATAFAEVIQTNLKELVTKEDLSHSTKALKDDLDRAVAELKRDHKELEQRLMLKMEATDAKNRGESVLVRWMLGVVLMGTLTIIVRMFLFRNAF